MFITILIFIAVISVLVLTHELGHFFSAKRAGMKVQELGFGFPPRLWSITRGGTEYSVNLILFGGFVKILGEDGEHGSEPGSFTSKPFRSRMSVVLAGVFMNFILAAVLLMVGNFLGLRIGLFTEQDIQAARDQKVQIIQVDAESPAAAADLRVLDEIRGFRLSSGAVERTVTTEAVQDFVARHQGQTVILVIQRGSELVDKDVKLRASPPAGQGPMGISLVLTGVISQNWYTSLWKGAYDAAILLANTVMGYWVLLKNLLIHGKLIADVSGPIGIAQLTGQAARVGLNYLIQFVAMISVNLAVLNLLPFPALDGGRAVLLVVEKLKGSPLNRRVEGTINTVGFLILIALMVLVTARDVGKFF